MSVRLLQLETILEVLQRWFDGYIMVFNLKSDCVWCSEKMSGQDKEILCQSATQNQLDTWGTVMLGAGEYVVHRSFIEWQGEHYHIWWLWNASWLRSQIDTRLRDYQTMISDLQTIFDSSYDVLYVSDGNGVTLSTSPSCQTVWGKTPEEIIGRSVYDLEKEGVFSPSATRIALETGQKVQVVQTTRTGRRLMVTSIPIKDSSGRIVRVVNASRDITQVQELEREIQVLRGIVSEYRQELAKLRDQHHKSDGQLVYRSKQMDELIDLIHRIGPVNTTVLIQGESGVGKEVIANYIHSLGTTSENPFIKINCASIPESLLESELFGYEAGAFTGALKHGRPGLFELANGGTLFLDEIGDMPLSLQVKLLRVLQEREIRRIGGKQSIPIEVRIITATNRNLEKLVETGAFREDLFYRINVVPLYVPPLRERREDIIPLVRHFLELYNQRFGRSVNLSSSALQAMEQYSWPGNVRELQNVIERLVVTADKDVIAISDLPLHIGSAHGSQVWLSRSGRKESIVVNELLPLKDATRMVEEQLIRMAAKGSRTLADVAQKLGVDQSTISRKMNKYKLQFDNMQCKNASLI
ncbi:sigma-54 interaction domain-containing protein [Alicyclobacillus macrosporangiidus]|uniref:sigma-54 interaction domain-containing protein n=1 Tax=Alicyclobacillus macrosporangiidus TaxID=392015 RepID=UPI00068E42CF|nr:sigma 54-interacting transcriptional regulator [Alicyclobacillus macrosporangiidus]